MPPITREPSGGWLIGPFIDSRFKTFPDDSQTPRGYLEAMLPHLNDGGIGTIAEFLDAEPPFKPRGCIAQAWSVAEWLRCWALVAEEPASRRVGLADRRTVTRQR